MMLDMASLNLIVGRKLSEFFRFSGMGLFKIRSDTPIRKTAQAVTGN